MTVPTAPASDAVPLEALLITLPTADGDVSMVSLRRFEELGLRSPERLPVTVKILLEMALRRHRDRAVSLSWIERVLLGDTDALGSFEFYPERILLQDLTGLPVLADLVTVLDADRPGGDRARFEVPVDLVVDHSLEVGSTGHPSALQENLAIEHARNEERFAFLRWAVDAFEGLEVIPPGNGIVHQLNMERLASVVTVHPAASQRSTRPLAVPDTLVGTDSHTPMVNALGVLGWGVGGIAAELAILGLGVSSDCRAVVELRLEGSLPEGSCAFDLALLLADRLRREGVHGALLEVTGSGAAQLTLADRATVANMAPEYGATTVFFPVDGATLAYLRQTGRSHGHIDMVDRYTREQGMDAAAEGVFARTIVVDLGDAGRSVAGPTRPQQRCPLGSSPGVEDVPGRGPGEVVALAALTSCTTTSNPRLMVAAGLIARQAVALGLRCPDWVKTPFTPGSRSVPAYLDHLGLLAPLEELGFHVAGFGCGPCHGNAGELDPGLVDRLAGSEAVPVAVLSGNRNFPLRVHRELGSAYLMSPALVVCHALAGRRNPDVMTEPLGFGRGGEPVYLRDLWPADNVIDDLVDRIPPYLLGPDLGAVSWPSTAHAKNGPWSDDQPGGRFLRPPFAACLAAWPPGPLRRARLLAVLGDEVTTDDISPVGRIAPDSPAGTYLQSCGLAKDDLGTFGAWRGNHEVMVRGAFTGPACSVAGAMGPDGSVMARAKSHRDAGVASVVVAGHSYGMGSSRDWAAKGPRLLGVAAILAVGFERIHRSNLIGLGITPLRFPAGTDVRTLSLDGSEELDLEVPEGAEPGRQVRVIVRRRGAVVADVLAERDVMDGAEEEFLAAGGALSHVARHRRRQAFGE